MMQDRLADLRAVAQQRNPQLAVPVLSEQQLLPTATQEDDEALAKPPPEFMKPYFAKIQVLKTAIDETSKNVDRIKQLKQTAMQATSPEQEKEISHELNHLLDGTNTMITKTKKALQVIKQQNTEFGVTGSDSAEYRIRCNMQQAITRRFAAVLGDYQTTQTEYKEQTRNKVARQVKIVYPEASEEEVQDMMSAGDMSAAMAVRSRISGSHQSLKNALSDIQDKYRDIRRLEQSVTELHQMFVEIATLVEHQGELLDQIEFSVTQAKDYTEKAEAELVVARKHQESAKKRMCWITICIIILCVIIALPIILLKLGS
eukprot:GHVS01009087.1.p1 GENE.GHVS01009087.1~~GHVS01009087.1.p1  ORF type:complete len:316 (+),score=55.16 GHVS01009087.1:76-1023(+)